MNAKDITRSTLERDLNDPIFLLTMAAHEVIPEEIELRTKDIIEYLEKTKPEEGEV